MWTSAFRPELEAVCALGSVSVLLGLVALLTFSRRSKPISAVSLFLAALALAGLATLGLLADLPPSLGQTTLGLSAFLLFFAFCRSSLVSHALSGIGRFLAHPPAQAGLLVLAGAAILVAQIAYIDHGLFPVADLEEELGLEFHLDLIPSGQTAYTDAGRAIPLWTPDPANLVELDEDHHFFKNNDTLRQKVIQTGSPDPAYNCHGWVFARGRAWVRGAVVDHILTDNHYSPVNQPRVGDVAVFRDSGGQVTHSGLVQTITPTGTILIESKWGRLGRFLHTPNDHAYRGHSLRYYRSDRVGHRLREPGKLAPRTVASS